MSAKYIEFMNVYIQDVCVFLHLQLLEGIGCQHFSYDIMGKIFSIFLLFSPPSLPSPFLSLSLSPSLQSAQDHVIIF